jgi:hypothetical protein
MKGGFILAEKNNGITIFSSSDCAEITGTYDKPGSAAMYPPYFAFAGGKDFKIYKIGTEEPYLTGSLKESIEDIYLDNGSAVFLLKDKIVILDYVNKAFTGLSPVPVDMKGVVLEGGRLNGFDENNFYSINYEEVSRGGMPEILKYPVDNVSACAPVTGSADAYCGGRFIRAGIEVGVPSRKSAVADGFTMHLDNSTLTAVGDNVTFSKELLLNAPLPVFCLSSQGLCMEDLNGVMTCLKDGQSVKIKELPVDCVNGVFEDGNIQDSAGNIVAPYAVKVNESKTHEMWKRELENGVYYFFTGK